LPSELAFDIGNELMVKQCKMCKRWREVEDVELERSGRSRSWRGVEEVEVGEGWKK
jgi:hypothetical protein